MTRRAALVIAGALLGIVASASVAWLASQVAGQRIGLASEPPSVAAGLVPRLAQATQTTASPRHRVRKARPSRPTTSPRTGPAVSAQPSPPITAAPTLPPSAPSASARPAAAPPTQPHPSQQRDDSGSGGSGSGGGGSGSQRDD